MSDLRKAAEMALEALEEINKLSVGENAICLPAEIDGAMEALRQALAQPDLAKVGEVGVWGHKREWVGLTDEDLEPVCDDWRIIFGPYVHDFSKAIEAKLKEKNT